MKKRRIRTILKLKGYRKSKGNFVKTCKCFKCKGKGFTEGWVAEGSYPDIHTYYQEPETCTDCKGTGKGLDITCIELERLSI